ncbi:MAG: GntR family transcriptional regulator [Actinomycetota bacterium]|nr:GntR family transcriptional regulator [Actinomycetota bacterium]
MTRDVVPLERRSTVDALATALRGRILDGEIEGGERLREQELSRTYDVARHTVRAALRALEAEGLVVLEPHRGARVASLDAPAIHGLYDLRAALETEAARLALDRHEGRVPDEVRHAVARLAAECRRQRPRWSAVADAHAAVHTALVEASGSPRIVAAYRALAAEMRLFLVQLRPSWTYERMAVDHEALVDDLERRGPDALRDHLRDSAVAVLERLERA